MFRYIPNKLMGCKVLGAPITFLSDALPFAVNIYQLNIQSLYCDGHWLNMPRLPWKPTDCSAQVPISFTVVWHECHRLQLNAHLNDKRLLKYHMLILLWYLIIYSYNVTEQHLN